MTQENKQNRGGTKPKNKGKKTQMVEKENKTKRRVFIRRQLNLLAFIKFLWLHWMVIKMGWSSPNSITTIGWRTK
jgi:uncharacterized ion transporter superfamily protein YfcC